MLLYCGVLVGILLWIIIVVSVIIGCEMLGQIVLELPIKGHLQEDIFCIPNKGWSFFLAHRHPLESRHKNSIMKEIQTDAVLRLLF